MAMRRVAPVTVSFDDLQAGKWSVAEAFGPEAIGLLVVTDVPGFAEARARLLPQSRDFATLPDTVKQQYEREDVSYCVGWSCGKEKFKGKPDLAKGSYYANPLFDDPALGDEAVRAEHPVMCAQNVWPTADLPDFEPAFKALGKVLADAGRIVVRGMDAYCREAGGSAYPERFMEKATFDNSTVCVGRLLHYFPSKQPQTAGEPEASWCGWHNDNSTLTGLCPSLYLDAEGREVTPDLADNSGLYCATRSGEVVKVVAPKHGCIFQLGEAAQMLSGGRLVAVPHMVQGSPLAVSREQFALFMEPSWDQVLDAPGCDREEALASCVPCDDVPALGLRWEDGATFGSFLAKSFHEYYKHGNEAVDTASTASGSASD